MKAISVVLLSATLAHTSFGQECPGYKASNVEKTESGVTADLTLAGGACNVYGEDIENLKLVVEYQTGKSRELFPKRLM